MDGADASTTFTDSEITPKTMTAVGNAQIDTAQSVFGGASGLFDGSSYISTPDHADFNHGTGDFTYDFWVRFSSLPTSGTVQVIYEKVAATYFQLRLHNVAGTLTWYMEGTAGVNVNIATTLAINTWYHMEFGRASGVGYIFQDGTKLKSGAFTVSLSSTAIATFGGKNAANVSLIGWLDEFRMSNGICRHTANFTPPTLPYGYSFSSPTAISPWIAIDQNTLDATIPVSIIEMAIAALQGITSTGNLKYQYALNNGADNGSWLTHAALVTALQGVTITNHTNSLRLTIQFNSDSSQAADATIASYLNASGITGGGGGLLVHPGHRGGYR